MSASANTSRFAWGGDSRRLSFALSGVVVAVMMLVGMMIGPAGPQWWRIPAELLDHVPFVSLNSGMSRAD